MGKKRMIKSPTKGLLLSIPEVSGMQNIPHRTLRRWCSDGLVKAEKVNGKWLIANEIAETLSYPVKESAPPTPPCHPVSKPKVVKVTELIQKQDVKAKSKAKKEAKKKAKGTDRNNCQGFLQIAQKIDCIDYLISLADKVEIKLDRASVYDLMEDYTTSHSPLFFFAHEPLLGANPENISIFLGKVKILTLEESDFEKIFPVATYTPERYDNQGILRENPYVIVNKLRLKVSQ